MYLHEEYIKRNNLNVPVIGYCRRSSVFLRSEDKPCFWYILAARWHDPDRHPGFFDLSLCTVNHNGHERDKLTDYVFKERICYWDQYESEIISVTNALKKRNMVAVKTDEQILAAWQIFLMMYDSWLAVNMSQTTFFKLVGTSLDSRIEYTKRLAAFEEAKNTVFLDKRLNNVWHDQLLPLTKNNSEWLVELING